MTYSYNGIEYESGNFEALLNYLSSASSEPKQYKLSIDYTLREILNYDTEHGITRAESLQQTALAVLAALERKH